MRLRCRPLYIYLYISLYIWCVHAAPCLFQLESLRTQYEAQVQALRQELEQERRSQTHHGDGVHTSTRAETVITGTEKVHTHFYRINLSCLRGGRMVQ